MSDFPEVQLLVVFTDLDRFSAQVGRVESAEAARVMNAYYELTGSTIRECGGQVVKFIGDATLAVFPPEDVDRGVLGLLELKEAADRFMEDHGWDCRMTVKVHYGPVVAGHFGAGPDKRYDVLGGTVNVAARLQSAGFALSAEAFRRLAPTTRKRFKKRTPPVTYIRLEDRHHRR